MKKVGGLIACFGLEDWWLNEFTDVERQRIEECYGKDSLTQGDIYATSQTAHGLIKAMASFWKPTPEDELLVLRLMAKANEMLIDSTHKGNKE